MHAHGREQGRAEQPRVLRSHDVRLVRLLGRCDQEGSHERDRRVLEGAGLGLRRLRRGAPRQRRHLPAVHRRARRKHRAPLWFHGDAVQGRRRRGRRDARGARGARLRVVWKGALSAHVPGSRGARAHRQGASVHDLHALHGGVQAGARHDDWTDARQRALRPPRKAQRHRAALRHTQGAEALGHDLRHAPVRRQGAEARAG